MERLYRLESHHTDADDPVLVAQRRSDARSRNAWRTTEATETPPTAAKGLGLGVGLITPDPTEPIEVARQRNAARSRDAWKGGGQ